LILSVASAIVPNAPLRVRFSAAQTLPAEVVALDRASDVALLHAVAHTDTTCLPIRDAPLAAGAAVFGVNSELSEDGAISLNGSVVQKTLQEGGTALLQVDPRIAKVEGGPLVDDKGHLAGVVSAHYGKPGGLSNAIEVHAALRALGIEPAAITDSRLMGASGEPAPAVGYVRDRDDPPFVMTKVYTYGTSVQAHRLRTISLVTAAVGFVGVAGSWLNFRANTHVSEASHNRAIVINDLGWVVLGLGVVGFGASYALPQGHDIVAVQTAKRELFVTLRPGGVVFGGRL
jgi:hypothetical protein